MFFIELNEALRRLTQGNECAQPLIAQEKSAPDQRADDNRHEERIAHAQVSAGCATEIACQQDRAEDGSLRNHIDGRAGEFENSKPESEAFRKSKMSEAFHDSNNWRTSISLSAPSPAGLG